MKNLFLEVPYASMNRTELENVSKTGVRAYKHSPDRVALQIRVRGKGAKFGYFMMAPLSHEQARELAAHLIQEADAILGFLPPNSAA